jgi:hypothetical protein
LHYDKAIATWQAKIQYDKIRFSFRAVLIADTASFATTI